MFRRMLTLVSLSVLFLSLASIRGVAQDLGCGTVVTPEQVRFEQDWQKLQSSLKIERSTDHYSIPLAIHIVRQSSGLGGLTLAELQIAFDSSNVYAAQTNVSFYLYGTVDYIDNDLYYFGMGNTANYDLLKQTNPVPGAINVYFVPPTEISGFSLCGISSFTSSPVQGIIMNNHCVDPTFARTVLFHEVGHYFDLYHTHETAFGVECPNGSNCTIAGDLLCDTPADPNVYQHVSGAPACLYDQYASLPPSCDGTPYDPPVLNIMSYSSKLCMLEMTPQQNTRFRQVLATVRSELVYAINGFVLMPPQIVDWSVQQGTVRDTTIRLAYAYNDTATVHSAVTTTGKFQVAVTLPATMDKTDTLNFALTFDASNLSGPCVLGRYSDTLVITTSIPGSSPMRVPLSANVSYGVPSYSETRLGAGCLRFTAPVTPGFGNITDSAFVVPGKNILYDGSLLIGMLQGSDTVAYMDLYTRNDFSPIDEFVRGIDSRGRTTQTLRFVTSDGRFAGNVKYTYGWNNTGLDSCGYVLVDYTLKNPCYAAATVYTGVFFDFDIGYNSATDMAQVNPDSKVAFVTDAGITRAGGVALLATCTEDPLISVVNNQDVIWQTGGLTPGWAYKLMAVPNPTGLIPSSDCSAMLSFGSTTIMAGGEAKYRYAVLGSNSSWTGLAHALADVVTMGGTSTICSYVAGDANGDGAVDISDAVFLIQFIFAGGPTPDPMNSGDANCDGAVDISDVVYLIQYIFSGGPAPC